LEGSSNIILKAKTFRINQAQEKFEDTRGIQKPSNESHTIHWPKEDKEHKSTFQ
jgi:hypothetical protein